MKKIILIVIVLLNLSLSANARDCITLSDDIDTSIIYGDTQCVIVPNINAATKLNYIAINSSLYHPEVLRRISREASINLVPSPDVAVVRSYISGSSRRDFILNIGKAPKKFETTTNERVPHSVSFVLRYQPNGEPFLVIITDSMNKVSSSSFSSTSYTSQSFLQFSVSAYTNSTSAAQCDESNRSPIDMPKTANLNNNIFISKKLKEIADSVWGADMAKYSFFYHQVRNGSRWDYKQLDPKYADFGNYNYGATGAALGIPSDVLLRAAGWAQVRAGTTDESWGHYLGDAPYGDDPADQAWIQKGINYYNDILSGKSITELDAIALARSDSCRGRNKENRTRGAERDSVVDNATPGIFIHNLPIEPTYVWRCFTVSCGGRVEITDLDGR